MDGLQEGLRGVVGEDEAGARCRGVAHRGDGIRQAAGFPDDGDGAVLHGVDLVEAAGLVARRHEEHVGPGLHEVGQLVVEGHQHPQFALILGGLGRQPAVIFLLAGAQDDHHEVPCHELGQHLGHQVEALLVRQAGDHGQDGGLGQLLIEPEGLHQGGLVGGLALEVVRAEVGGQQLVGLRAPLPVIHPVQDAVQVGGAVAQHPLQAVAELRGLDLLAVAGADGGDGVGVDDAALEQVDLVVVFQAVDAEQGPGPGPAASTYPGRTAPGRPGCGWSARSWSRPGSLPRAQRLRNRPAPGRSASRGSGSGRA